MEVLTFYLIVGILAGTLAGLLGIGGGIIIVPALAWIFQSKGFPETIIMHLAVGTSLATIVVTAISSVRAHHSHGAIRWEVLRRLIPGLVFGVLLGAMVADTLSTDSLRIFFSVFVMVVGSQMMFGASPAPHRNLPRSLGMIAVSTVIGGVATLVGIGGGNLVVPFLVWCNVPIRNAVGTAAAAGLPIALVGATSYILTGFNAHGLPRWSTGYVYWPAFAGIVGMSMVCAPVGARLAHTLPTAVLKRSFGVFLGLVGIKMLLG